MRRTFLALPIFLLIFTAKAQSQEPLLTKQEAIDMVLENNLDILVARNTKKIDENNASILNSRYLPSVTALAGGSIDRQNTEGQGSR